MKASRCFFVALLSGLLLVLFAALTLAQGGTLQARGETRESSSPPGSLQGPDSQLAAPLATTLKLSIPDLTLQKWYSASDQDGSRGEAYLNLWNYTTYDGDLADLTYQASIIGGDGLAYDIVDGHFLSITVTTHIVDKLIDLQVEVGDGTLLYHEQFTVETAPAPYIDFYEVYGGYPLDDPLVVVAGKSLEEPLDLDYYSGNKYGYPTIEDQVFTIVNTVPASLHVTIYTDPDAGPFDCEHCLDIQPTGATIGSHAVEVQIVNSYGLTATDTFRVKVIGRVFLPTVLGNY
jgi:hypothetical protein